MLYTLVGGGTTMALKVLNYSSLDNLATPNKEPQIAIKSNIAVNELYICDNPPASPKKGDVNIFSGHNTKETIWKHTIKPFKKINLEIYPDLVKQYDGSNWVTVPFKVYVDGAWRDGVNPTNQNKWEWKKYQAIYARATGKYPHPSDVASLTPTDIKYFNEPTARNQIQADNYTAKCTCYLFVEADVQLASTFETDDEGSVTINDVQIGDLVSCTAKKLTYQLIKGWNKIEICYNEGSGGDGWIVTPTFANTTEIKYMYASI